jgi:polar amino acid transport system ATP-binding protein
MQQAIVDVKGLRKSFGSHVVLKDIDFTVAQPGGGHHRPQRQRQEHLPALLNGLETAEGGTAVVCGHPVVEGGRMMPEPKLDACVPRWAWCSSPSTCSRT